MSLRPVVLAILVVSFGLSLPVVARSQEPEEDETSAAEPEEEPAADEAVAEEPADEETADAPAEAPAADEAAAPEEPAPVSERAPAPTPAATPAPAPAPAASPAPMSGREEQEDTTRYKVVVNHEEQYSIWPADKENALGWRDAGKAGTKQECLDYIKDVWTDMRPLSLRKQMEEAAKDKPQP